MNARRTVSALLALGLALVLAAGMSAAQDRAPRDRSSQGGSAPLGLVGTGFTYQGRLTDGGSPANGEYDLSFTLHWQAEGGESPWDTIYFEDLTVSEGLFTVQLDFGPNAFYGSERWLEIGVRPWDSEDAYTMLEPLQPLTPVPSALALPGLWTQQVGDSPNLIGGYRGNWVSDGAFGATIGGGGADWAVNRVTDNMGTVAGGGNNQAGNDDGDFWNGDGAAVGGGWENTASGPISTVGGGANNHAEAYGATVAGGEWNTANNDRAAVGGGWGNTAGGVNAVVGGGGSNTADGGNATVGGGWGNLASGEWNATVAGGAENVAGATDSTVGGGTGNTAEGWAATISGGYTNTVTAGAGTIGGGEANLVSGDEATVGGGNGNEASGYAASICGGESNQASGFYATVAGGYSNTAEGNYSFAAGREAHAIYDGTFVWADDQGLVSDFASTAPNQFLIRAQGGVGIGTNQPGGAELAVSGEEGMPVFVGSRGIENGWRTYLGFNVYWNGAQWVAKGDTANNGGALLTTSWINGKLRFHTFDSTGGDDQVVSENDRMVIRGDNGYVGIGEDSPQAALHVNGGRIRLENAGKVIDLGVDGAAVDLRSDTSSIFIRSEATGSCPYDCNNVLINPFSTDGNVGIGTDQPQAELDVAGDMRVRGDYQWVANSDFELLGGGDFSFDFEDSDGNDHWLVWSESTGTILTVRNDGRVGVGISEPQAKLDVNGTTRTKVVQITGGSDLAEPFEIVGRENVKPGMVVSIDPERPGQLRLAEKAYDRMVAGCVSGANGLKPGLVMQQEGSAADGSFPVALSGRVYCWADAAYGPIQPGDLLTTSDTPGHVMVVRDYERAQGAIIGKAMAALEEGRGLILILVTLQ
jgi:hypothetical protein